MTLTDKIQLSMIGVGASALALGVAISFLWLAHRKGRQ